MLCLLALTFRAGDGPGLFHLALGGSGHFHGLHHLTHGAVGQQHGGNQVLFAEVEGLGGEVSHFLNGSGPDFFADWPP